MLMFFHSHNIYIRYTPVKNITWSKLPRDQMYIAYKDKVDINTYAYYF
jgi:hypothetical protein